MKKLMFAAAAVAASVAFADGITSSNIAGYYVTAPNPEATETPCFGACFASIGGGKQTLGSFAPVDGTSEYGTDMIQVINPTSQEADYIMSYCDPTIAAIYQAAAGGELKDYIGWWYEGYEPGDTDPNARADDYEIGLGDGFMGSFSSEVQFTSLGQVHTAATSFIANPEATETPVFANYLPRPIPLKYMTPVDGTSEYGTDMIQVINPTTQEADYIMSYCDPTIAAIYQAAAGGELEDYIGWWYDGYEPGDTDPNARADGYPVAAGAGFMGSFSSEVEIQMPSALVEIKDSEFVVPPAAE